MKRSINHRIELLINEKKMNPNSFSVAIKQLPQTTNKILKDLNKPGFDYINSILTTFSDINARWLLTGNDEMFMQKQENSYISNNLSKEVNAVEEKNIEISRLQNEVDGQRGIITVLSKNISDLIQIVNEKLPSGSNRNPVKNKQVSNPKN